MKQLEKFVTSHTFSGIPEIQEEALDTYEVVETETGVKISYSCKCINKPIVKEEVVAPISFSLAKNLTVFLSENACREKIWMDVLNDCIVQNVKQRLNNRLCDYNFYLLFPLRKIYNYHTSAA